MAFLNPLDALSPKIPFPILPDFLVWVTSEAQGSVSVGVWVLRATCTHHVKFQYVCFRGHCFPPASKLKGPLPNGHPRLVHWLGSVNGRSGQAAKSVKIDTSDED